MDNNTKKPSWDLSDADMGQLVIVCCLFGRTWHYELSNVTRITPTLVECIYHDRTYQFYKKNGTLRGKHSFYTNLSIKRYDEEWWQKHLAEEQAKKERADLLSFVQNTSWTSLTNEKLQTIKDIIEN